MHISAYEENVMSQNASTLFVRKPIRGRTRDGVDPAFNATKVVSRTSLGNLPRLMKDSHHLSGIKAASYTDKLHCSEPAVRWIN